MFIATRVSEAVPDRLRDGARVVLEGAFAALGTPAPLAPERSRRACTDELFGRATRAVWLLDTIGWRAHDAIPAAVVDVDEHGLALCEALGEAVRTATVEVRDATTPDARDRLGVAALPLFAFALLVEAACLERGVDGEGVRAFQERLQAFSDEVESDAHSSARRVRCAGGLVGRFAARRGSSAGKCCSSQSR